MHIQRSFRLALVCFTWMILAPVIQVLSVGGSFCQSALPYRVTTKIWHMSPQRSVVAYDLVRLQFRRGNRCSIQGLNLRKQFIDHLKAPKIAFVNFSRQRCVFDLFWSLPWLLAQSGCSVFVGCIGRQREMCMGSPSPWDCWDSEVGMRKAQHLPSGAGCAGIGSGVGG